MDVTASEELCCCRVFPSGAHRPLPAVVAAPALSWLRKVQVFVIAQASSEGLAYCRLRHCRTAYTPSHNFADYNGRLRFLSDSWMSDIWWLFCNIPQATFSTKPESGISAKKSSNSYVFKPGKLVLGLFPLIRVNHKKGSIPTAFLPGSLCRWRPKLWYLWGDAGVVVALHY